METKGLFYFLPVRAKTPVREQRMLAGHFRRWRQDLLTWTGGPAGMWLVDLRQVINVKAFACFCRRLRSEKAASQYSCGPSQVAQPVCVVLPAFSSALRTLIISQGSSQCEERLFLSIAWSSPRGQNCKKPFGGRWSEQGGEADRQFWGTLQGSQAFRERQGTRAAHFAYVSSSL
ncbi:hypothetical protein RRG08_031820 [Elysia crispata]|uniref:Uncharacterized protein n=1 Tax=Elysia crispata TaxID=231223 RepID=A0AAE0Y636_9GAST|nr:hypothetical protein RRG08_031820 [Elysia crispata]